MPSPVASSTQLPGSGVALIWKLTVASGFTASALEPPKISKKPVSLPGATPGGSATENNVPVKFSPGSRLKGKSKKKPKSSIVLAPGIVSPKLSKFRNTVALLANGADTVASNISVEPERPSVLGGSVLG